MFEGLETLVIVNDSIKRCNVIITFLYIVIPITKVSGPSNIFSINALLKNLVLKHYTV